MKHKLLGTLAGPAAALPSQAETATSANLHLRAASILTSVLAWTDYPNLCFSCNSPVLLQSQPRSGDTKEDTRECFPFPCSFCCQGDTCPSSIKPFKGGLAFLCTWLFYSSFSSG